jgi:hypothetical protein
MDGFRVEAGRGGPFAAHAFQVTQHPAGVTDQGVAMGRGEAALRGPVEQPGAQHVLQFREHARHRWLGGGHALRRHADVVDFVQQ